MNIFVDTSFLVASVIRADVHHKLAKDIILKTKGHFYANNLVKFETVNVICRKDKIKKVKGVIGWFESRKIEIIAIGHEIWTIAYKDLLGKYRNDGPNVFDFIHFACMKKFGIKNVLTFDKHFAEFGFKILKPDLLTC